MENDYEKIIRKGMRYRKPIELRLKIRPEVYSWLAECSVGPPSCAVEVLARGFVEDAYDRYQTKGPAAPEHSDQEESAN